MKFSTTTLLAMLAASITTSYAKPYVHPRPSLRRLDDSEDDSDDEPVTKRECELESDTGVEIEFKCKSKTKSDLLKMEDEIKYKVKYDDKGLKVKVKYEQEVETETPDAEELPETIDVDEPEAADNEEPEAGDAERRRAEQTQTTETEYEVVFDRLIEYAKPAGVVAASANAQAYNFAEDTTLNSIDLTNMSPFTPVVVKPNGDITWNISTVDSVVTFFFTISPGGENAEVTANKMKIDVDIKGYQWQQSTSNVAILASVESGVEVDIDYSDDEQTQPSNVAVNFAAGSGSIDASSLRPFGEFTWARDAVAVAAGGSNATNGTEVPSTSPPPVSAAQAEDLAGNGADAINGTGLVEAVVTNNTTIQVVATSPSDASDSSIAFSFVGDAAQMADEIFWDPEAGIGYAPSGAVGLRGLVGVCGMALAVMFGTTYM